MPATRAASVNDMAEAGPPSDTARVDLNIYGSPKTTNQDNERAIKKGRGLACKPRLSAGERSSASCRLAQGHHGLGDALERLAGPPRRGQHIVERPAVGNGQRPPQQRG